MVRLMTLLLSGLLLCESALAWNCQGHRLVAAIAWQTLDANAQGEIARLLGGHPDFPRWKTKAGEEGAAGVFIEAACWADEIRHDPRFYDERHDAPTDPLPGLVDHAMHRDWHYLDFDRDGRPVKGQLLVQINALAQQLGSTHPAATRRWAVPWLTHLVADLHQPLHVGYDDDAGGNDWMLEVPDNPVQPFVNLHRFWDDLGGTRTLRGSPLFNLARTLVMRYPDAASLVPDAWLGETRSLLAKAYPQRQGSLLWLADAPFVQQSRRTAEEQLARAGQRLGRLLQKHLDP